jgi:hypothetical protein
MKTAIARRCFAVAATARRLSAPSNRDMEQFPVNAARLKLWDLHRWGNQQ